MTMRTAVTGALKFIVELLRQEINGNNFLIASTYERTNKHGIEIVFVDCILPIYTAILRQMVCGRLKWQKLERQQIY